MHLLFLLLSTFLLVDSLDNILLPFERFQYDLEQFTPVVSQEVEFAELSGLTDDQAFEQLKSFFPTLQLRIQQLRNLGVQADENRRKYKELADEMCGQGHNFGYLKVDHKLRNILEVITSQKVTVKNNLKMLTAIRDDLIDWGRSSKAPCRRQL
ncbi:unnamed protein product [Caenorhabditis sp. 36 PRJEB53466]|nr:unnamed protein product [Caenorhabditis sp. 36 PRJEB53466]